MIGDFDLIKREFESILSYSQAYPFEIDSEQTLRAWLDAKQPIIDLFGGLTYWRSERPIKVKLSDELRRRRFDEFLDECVDNDLIQDDEFYFFLKDNREGFFENKVVKDFPERNIHKGSKLLKSFKHFISDREITRWIQDTASTYIQQDKIEGYLYLSVDPRDFLTLSENDSKWTSCHSLDGDYRAGNLSYMVDKTTIIAYIASGNKEHFKCMPGFMKWFDKKWRMLVHINKDGVIYYNKQYPFQHEVLLDITDRAVVDKFFPKQKNSFTGPMDIGFREIIMPTGETELLDRNMMYAGSKIYDAKDVINLRNCLGYHDLIKSRNYTPIVSVLNSLYQKYRDEMFDETSLEDDAFHRAFDITIGDKVPCPCCGEEYLQRDNSFLCDMCIAENDADEDFYCFCSGCGRHIYDDDEYVVIGDEIYCESCEREMAGMEEEEE